MSAMADAGGAVVKNVPAGAQEVRVVSLAEGQAGALWLLEKPEDAASKAPQGSCSEPVLELFLMLCKSKAGSDLASPPSLHQLVAVRNPSTGTWHRGMVKSIDTESDSYSVFLLDHGTMLTVSLSDMSNLPENMSRRKPAAFQFILYNVIPAEMVKDFETGKMKLVVMQDWSAEANTFMKKQVEKSHIGYIVSKASNKKDETHFGDLYVVVEGGYLNLGLLLVYSKHAILDHRLFAEKYSLKLQENPNSMMDDLPSDVLERDVFGGKSGMKVTSQPSHRNLKGSFSYETKNIADSCGMNEEQQKPDFGKLNFNQDAHSQENFTNFPSKSSPKKQESGLKQTSECYGLRKLGNIISGRRSPQTNCFSDKGDEQLDQHHKSCDVAAKPFCDLKNGNLTKQSPRGAVSMPVLDPKCLAAQHKARDMCSYENFNKSNPESHLCADNFQRPSVVRESKNNNFFNDRNSDPLQGYVPRKGNNDKIHSYGDKLLQDSDISNSSERVAPGNSMMARYGLETQQSFRERHFSDIPFAKNEIFPKKSGRHRNLWTKIACKSSESSERNYDSDNANRRDRSKEESNFSSNNSSNLDSRLCESWSDKEGSEVKDAGNIINGRSPPNANKPTDSIPHSVEIQGPSSFSKRNASLWKICEPSTDSKKISDINKSCNSDCKETTSNPLASKFTWSPKTFSNEVKGSESYVQLKQQFNQKVLNINIFTGKGSNVLNDPNLQTGSSKEKKVPSPEVHKEDKFESIGVPEKVINGDCSMHRMDKEIGKPTGGMFKKDPPLSVKLEKYPIHLISHITCLRFI